MHNKTVGLFVVIGSLLLLVTIFPVRTLLVQNPTTEELNEVFTQFESEGGHVKDLNVEDIEKLVAKVRHHKALIDQGMARNKAEWLKSLVVCRETEEAFRLLQVARACSSDECRDPAVKALLKYRDECVKKGVK